MNFNSKRTGKGTLEWAEFNCGITVGCPNNCLYCYAAHNADRFGYHKRKNWHKERFSKNSKIKSYPAREGVIMFPSTHDITPFNLTEYIRVAKLILKKGNQLLIVSKPNMYCLSTMLDQFKRWKDQILFRFTIGSIDEGLCSFWEPGAPTPKERLNCLRKAFDSGYKTSVSIEPMLGGKLITIAVVHAAIDFVTETIWIGKMNKPRLRVDMTIPANIEAVEKIEFMQNNQAIVKLYHALKDSPKIRWKDSIKAVINGK